MKSRKRAGIRGNLGGALLAALLSSPAAAENLDLGELSAAIAFPVMTGGQRSNPIKNTNGDVVVYDEDAVTLVTVTNGKTDPVRLKIDMISGDPYDSDQWQSTSFDCDLTGRETTVFVIVPNDRGSKVYAECSFLAQNRTDGVAIRKFTNVQNGILFVAVADPSSGALISEDVIFGDAVVVDVNQGQAYSFGGIPFQAGKGQNDGNKVYRFDDLEYAQFPAALATNFLAPTADVGTPTAAGYVEAELVLFTLDGTTGETPVPRAKLGGLAFNDDEEYFDFQYEFDCFDVVSLLDLDPNFVFEPSGSGLGSIVGHLELTPQAIGASGLAFSAHDAQYGDGNNIRKRPVHGWIVQATTGVFVAPDQPVPGTPTQYLTMNGSWWPGDEMCQSECDMDSAAWGRELFQSRTALRPFLADKDPVLGADPRLR